VNILSKIGLPLVIAVVKPCKVGALSAAVGPRGEWIARVPQGEFSLLQSSRLECRLQVHGGAGWQAYFGVGTVGVAVLGPVLSPPLHATKVQLGVDVFHAMVGRLEVAEDVLACCA
jgi:hypothetical protein